MILKIAAVFFATLLFSVEFNVPRKELFFCGLTGALGWSIYIFLAMAMGSVVLPNLLGTFVIAYVSRMFSFRRAMPLTVFLIPGIIPLVPGAGAYYTMYYMITGDLTASNLKGIETMKIAGAIVVGIVIILALPQKTIIRRWPFDVFKTKKSRPSIQKAGDK